MAKNIVVFSDGTGQEGGKGNNTNVYKLFNMIEDLITLLPKKKEIVKNIIDTLNRSKKKLLTKPVK